MPASRNGLAAWTGGPRRQRKVQRSHRGFLVHVLDVVGDLVAESESFGGAAGKRRSLGQPRCRQREFERQMQKRAAFGGCDRLIPGSRVGHAAWRQAIGGLALFSFRDCIMGWREQPWQRVGS